MKAGEEVGYSERAVCRWRVENPEVWAEVVSIRDAQVRDIADAMYQEAVEAERAALEACKRVVTEGAEPKDIAQNARTISDIRMRADQRRRLDAGLPTHRTHAVVDDAAMLRDIARMRHENPLLARELDEALLMLPADVVAPIEDARDGESDEAEQ